MSDRPAGKSDKPNGEESGGGWFKPQAKGMWRPPPEKTEASSGWRVPTLPTGLKTVPSDEGAWHLPKPEDTVYTAEDVIEIKRPEDTELRPEDALLEEAAPEEKAVPESRPIAPEDLVPLAEEEPVEEEVPPQETAPKLTAPEDLLALAIQAESSGVPPEDDDDFNTFSMSELVALASLAESEQPQADVVPGAAAPTLVGIAPVQTPAEQPLNLEGLSPAERALLQATEALPGAADLDQTALDAAEYARRQLEQLEGEPSEKAESPQAPGSLIQSPSATGALDVATDPAAYARRQLEQLEGGAASEFTPVPEQTAPVDPAQMELARKFRDTEDQIRSLRNMYRAGQITRDDLQAQLRQLMILDNNQVWWMMGVETDTWYKFENNDWIPATPPALPSPARGGVPTETGAFDPNQVNLASLPYLPTQEEYSQGATAYETGYSSDPYAGTGGLRVDENFMPLPQQVPMQDPNATMVGPSYLEPVRRSEAPTLEATQPAVAQPTVRAQPVQYGSVEAPIDTTAEPPDYTLEESPVYREIAQKRQQSMIRALILAAVIFVGLAFIAGAAFVVFAVSWYNGIVSQWEPQIVALQNFEPQFQTAKILDAAGNLIAELTSQEGGARTKVKLADIAPEFIHAVISVENERFYQDPGWDIVAITRAFFQNLTTGDIASGGSTITQQIARNLVLQNAEATAERKINEIVIAGEIAKRYDKNFILELYLNEVFFGNRSYGVEAAAEFYFNKTAADLNLAESALLAGLIQSPATYDPVVNRSEAFARMKTVIDRMVQVGCLQFQHDPYRTQPFCISRSEVYRAEGEYTGQLAVQVAFIEGRNFTSREFDVKYPHFVNLVQAQIENIFGAGEMFRRGFTIKTTLIPQIQDAAQDALVRQLQAIVNTGINTGAVMATDPRTGAIWAMVGSPDFNNADIDGQVNNALTWQQPGSSIKPVVYTAALEGVDKNNNGVIETGEYFTPATILWDVPTFYPQFNYRPTNFDNRFRGPIPLRFALGNSYNIPAIKTYEFIGNDKFKSTAERMGLKFLPDAAFTLASGVGATDVRLYDMMQAYGTLANNGQHISLYAIESVTDSAGREVPLPGRAAPQQVIQPQIAYLMQSILSDDNARANAFGTNSLLTLPGYPRQDAVAAKTGTSNESRDLWTLGFTRSVVVGVWLGRPDNNPTVGGGAFTLVAPIWNQVMRVATAGKPVQPFANPGNVVQQQICADTGTLPGSSCSAVRGELFLVTQPPPPADQAFVVTLEVDSWSNLRANENCPDNRITKTFVNIADQSAIDWLKTAEGQAFAQRIGLPANFEVAPTGSCAFGAIIPTARIIQPFDNQTLQGNFSVTGQVSTGAEFSRYQLEYAPAQTPDQFQIIGNFSTTQQPNAGSVLGTWDTTRIPNGTYILRLAVFSNTGGFIFRTVTVNINNPLPTQPPPPTATPPQPVIITPIPFDTLPASSAGAQSVGGPTPTVEVPR